MASTFTVLYFASAGSYTGQEQEFFSAPLPLNQLFDHLESKYPGIKAKVLDSCLVTVNLDYVDMPADGITLQASDEVAIIPPVSSG